MATEITIHKILDFWFKTPMSDHWFSSTPAIDASIKQQYETCWESARAGAYNDWMLSPNAANGCLALCILLDQFPLNMFRGKAKSFSTEQQAVTISKYAINKQLDQEISSKRVSFLYMPLMHSENLDDQDLAVKSFAGRGLDNNLRFAKHHRDIIRQFGRFPHRNESLGRNSTAEEIAYLNSDNAFKG